MATPKPHKLNVNTARFSLLDSVPPFVNVCLKSAVINASEFARIVQLAASYPNDARLIEMVRRGRDASAKVPYLMAEGETPESILVTLREVARPHVARLQKLPEPLRATIYLLLSINAVPNGCEEYGITALLEIDRMQGEMIHTLRRLMAGRQLAKDFYQDNVAALQQLDQDWPRLRSKAGKQWPHRKLPEQTHMQYYPLYDNKRLVGLYETCVVVDTPGERTLKRFTPAVLQRPLPAKEPVPATGSVDWLIRDVGKIGRHFTRALLSIIKMHLEAEQVALEAGNHTRIEREAREAVQEFLRRTP